MFKLILTIVALFLLGWFASSAFTGFAIYEEFPEDLSALEKDSPSNYLNEDNIIVLGNQVILDVDNAYLTKYANTNSMDPTLDDAANGIEIPYTSSMILNPGDIISFRFNNMIRVHRIMLIGSDEEGIYYLTQGDNAQYLDPIKIRQSQIQGKLIGILY